MYNPYTRQGERKYAKQLSDLHLSKKMGPSALYGHPMVNPTIAAMEDVEKQADHENFTRGGLTSKDNPFLMSTGESSVQRSGEQKLDDVLAIYLKQKVDRMSMLTGCQIENNYEICTYHPKMQKKGHLILRGKETSGFFAKTCLANRCRAFNMTVYNPTGQDDTEQEVFLTLEKPCTCSCFGFNKPNIYVTLLESGRNDYLGKIEDSFSPCDVKLAIYDKDHAHKYTIGGNSCQTGVFCMSTCESCQSVNIDVKDESGDVVSNIHKRTSACFGCNSNDTNNLVLEFPKNATSDDKALLLAAVIFADFKYWEINSN